MLATRPDAVHLNVIESYFACLNSEDWKRMGALWCEECEFHTVGTHERRGRTAVLQFFARMFSAWKAHYEAPGRVFSADQSLAVEAYFTGTHVSGKRVTFEAIDVIDFKGGQIERIRSWYDLIAVRQKLAEL